MIRLFGAVLLACACLWIGEKRARELRTRVDVLDGLMDALDGINRELEIRLTPLPQLMEEQGEYASPLVRELFLSCRKGLEGLRQESFSQVWTNLVEEIPHLKREDKRTLWSLGCVLGRYDGRGQSAAISGVCRELERNREQAWQISCRLGRVYRAVGAAAGGFLIVFLL